MKYESSKSIFALFDIKCVILDKKCGGHKQILTITKHFVERIMGILLLLYPTRPKPVEHRYVFSKAFGNFLGMVETGPFFCKGTYS